MAKSSARHTKGGGDCGRLELLSPFNQTSPRVYITIILCFSLPDATFEACFRHLQLSLARLAAERPLFAARLQAGCKSHPGLAHLHQSSDNDIPLTCSKSANSLEKTYENMRACRFPPDLFIKPYFGGPGPIEPGTEPLPAVRVHAHFVKGGVLLAISLHHSISDGDSLRIFLECFAAQTRGEKVKQPSKQTFRNAQHDISGKRDSIDNSIFEKLINKTPEYTILPERSGPTQPRLLDSVKKPVNLIEKTGKIFVFRRDRIQILRRLIHHLHSESPLPSAYTSLASLAFAHITQARLDAEDYFPSSKVGDTASLWNSVNWKSRAFQDLTHDYFGNATLPVVSKIPTERLLRACRDLGELAEIVPAVKASIDAVDEEYVQRRLAMISATPDPCRIGVNYDPRMPDSLAFNTWRHFGADTCWRLAPRCATRKPDAIRRGQSFWNLCTALVLPARADATRQELFVNLSKVGMEKLCQDPLWMSWVDEVIG